MVLMTFVKIEAYKLTTRDSLNELHKSWKDLEINPKDFGKASELPDIYYIIFDAYASTSTLKEVYNYDNQNFNDFLTAKGFYVTSKSQTNYPLSFLSLASSLNMKYINYLTDICKR